MTGTRKNSLTRTRHRFEPRSDDEDGYRPKPRRNSNTSEQDAYQYGPGDDDEEDEYATIYDGDDQGAKMRRY